MSQRQRHGITAHVPWVILAALLGGITFVVAQGLGGFPQHIAQYMGRQIVRTGGHPESLASVIGWTVHFGVSISYAALFAILAHLPFWPDGRAVRWGGGALVALVLAKLTTLITSPAIAVTIGVLGGTGLPESIPGLNTVHGFPFWNHLGFFAICWFVIAVLPDLVRKR